HRWQPIVLPLRPAILDEDVLILDVAELLETSAERGNAIVQLRRVQKPDYGHRWLLRSRRERPRCCRAAEQRDELAPPHSITSSARASSVGGTVRPSALAVFMLMISSTLVDCCTGMLAGFSPLRIRPAYTPTTRSVSERPAPYPIRPPALANSRLH